MSFIDFLKGRKRDSFDIKKPLTEPLGALPALDTSLPDNNFQNDILLQQDTGIPRTQSIEPKPFSAMEQKYRMPEFEEQQNSRGSSGNSSSFQAQNPYQSSASSVTLEKDIQIISSKLDYLKAMLENLNHRLESLERIAKGEEEEVKW